VQCQYTRALEKYLGHNSSHASCGYDFMKYDPNMSEGAAYNNDAQPAQEEPAEEPAPKRRRAVRVSPQSQHQSAPALFMLRRCYTSSLRWKWRNGRFSSKQRHAEDW
jgi:hypothetical protein